MKIHVKRTEANRLSLCGVFAKENWVLWESADKQAEGAVCKICKGMAEKVLTKAAAS
jgi:hypothetical protein